MGEELVRDRGSQQSEPRAAELRALLNDKLINQESLWMVTG